MKWKILGQLSLAAAVSVGLGYGVTSCARSNTVDYLYMTSAKNNPGQVNVYRVDSQSGGLSQIPNSPYPAGRNPVGLVTSPNGKNLYVINHDDNTIIVYGIGTDAKLYPQHTYQTPGSEPVALAINQAGTVLFVVDFYAPNFTDLNPGYGALVVYPIGANGVLGTDGAGAPATQTLPGGQSASYLPLGNAPTAVSVLPNGSTVYVADQLTAAATGCNAGAGAVVALSVASNGALTPVTGSPFCAGTLPTAVTTHPTGSYLYVADGSAGEILGYSVDATGALTTFPSGAIAAGQDPDSIVIDTNGTFMYVANRGSGTVQSYTVASTGIPSSTGTVQTGPYPQCVIIEPNLHRFLYTADFNGLGATGYKINPTSGALNGTENSPYAGTGLATCLAATAHEGTN